MTDALGQAARGVLHDCLTVYRDSPRATGLLRRHLDRLDEPVLVTVTGPPGSGKSTLADALAGARALRDAVIADGHRDTPPAAVHAESDAVLHLIRGRHDQELPAPSLPVNTIAVLCRTDEIGGGRIDALTSGRQLARRSRRDPRLRASCQTVVAVAGLVAQAGRTLTEAEYTALAALARCPRPELDDLLLSADRFLRTDTLAPLPAGTRRELLDRLGIFGVRLTTALIRSGTEGAAQLSAELVQRSGLAELREAVREFFVERREVLKARSALLAVELVLRAEPRPPARGAAAELERVLAGAHEFAELRLLASLQAHPSALLGDRTDEARRLTGGAGTGIGDRLGLAYQATGAELWDLIMDALERWQRHAADPLGGSATRRAAAVVVRSCEGMLAAVDRAPDRALQ